MHGRKPSLLLAIETTTTIETPIFVIDSGVYAPEWFKFLICTSFHSVNNKKPYLVVLAYMLAERRENEKNITNVYYKYISLNKQNVVREASTGITYLRVMLT